LRVRPSTFDDAAGIAQVHKRNAMGCLNTVEWRKGWEDYPFEQEFRDVPIGWVLETEDGSIVGTLDNVHLLYEIDGRRIKACIAAGWAVDVEHRGKALQLMTTFLRQKGIDLWLNVSASATTAQILTGLRISRIPIPEYDVPCFWAVRPRNFAKAVLTRKSIWGAAVLSWPAGLALLARDVIGRSGRGRISAAGLSGQTIIRRLTSFDDRFDSFWEDMAAGPPRLRALRTRAVLNWKFRAELGSGRAYIVAAEDGGRLSGYAVIVRRQGSEQGLELCDVADIQALRDEPAIIRGLLLASIAIARETRVDAVKFMTGMPAKRSSAEALRPYTYRLPFWQQYYKTASPELKAALTTAENWDISLFDIF
jgi:hypothetical protein